MALSAVLGTAGAVTGLCAAGFTFGSKMALQHEQKQAAEARKARLAALEEERESRLQALEARYAAKLEQRLDDYMKSLTTPDKTNPLTTDNGTISLTF